MTRCSCLLALALLLLVSGVARARDYPIMDMIANKMFECGMLP
jgi:hypothetical protein